jgi:hypothetical protein
MAAKIALSAFHPIFTGIMAAGSQLARGTEAAFGASSAKEAFAGIADMLKGATVVPAAFENLVKGYKLAQLGENVVDAKGLPDILRLVVNSSGRIISEHQVANNFTGTFKRLRESGSFGELGKNTLDALSNIVSGPVMRGWVPWIKLGSLASSLQHELRMAVKRNPNMTGDELAQLARGVVAVHDNFFGQMIPENLGFARWMQEFLHAAIQFPGWNIGTARTGMALARGFKSAAFGQKLDPVADITSRYALGILVSTGFAGAVVHAIHNGGQFPQTFEDAFYPRTQSGERISMPTHVRTGVSFARDPVGFVAGKGNPIIKATLELMDNLDEYANKQIRTPEAGFVQQAGEVAGYLGKQVEPIPVAAGRRIAESGEPTSITGVERFLGFGRAPKSLSRSAAENKAAEYNLAMLPRGGQAPAEAETTSLKNGIVHALRTNAPDANARLQKALEAGKIQWTDIRSLVKKAALTPLQASFQHLGAEHTVEVWKVATNDERQQLMQMYVRKLANKPEVAASLGFGARQ